jgi:hypothetical protein
LGSCEARFKARRSGNSQDVLTTMPNFSHRVRGAPARKALRRLSLRAPRADRPRVSAVVIEEEAASLLYGERSGMVNASPVVPPLEEPAGPRR